MRSVAFLSFLFVSVRTLPVPVSLSARDALAIREEGPGVVADPTATKAASSQTIQNNGACLDITNKSLGNNRGNKVPIAVKACSGATSQLWDLIIKGVHNDGVNTTIIASAETFACIDRVAANNNPGTFTCGGRADGSGKTSLNQQFFFDAKTDLSKPFGLPLKSGSKNKGVGDGNSCLANVGGALVATPCSPPKFDASQLFTVGGGATGNQAQGQAPPPPPPPAPPAAATTTSAAQQASAPPTPPAAAPPATDTTFVLPGPDKGFGASFDATATRAATTKTIRNGGLCVDINDKSSGDFRLNKIQIAMKPCINGGSAGQQWDLITKGQHNNHANATLIVSVQTFLCIDRRSAAENPGTFACGGRADGEGETTDDQLYIFPPGTDVSKPIGFPLQRDAVNNGVGPGNRCLTNNGSRLVVSACDPPKFLDTQLFTIV